MWYENLMKEKKRMPLTKIQIISFDDNLRYITINGNTIYCDKEKPLSSLEVKRIKTEEVEVDTEFLKWVLNESSD